MKVTQDLRTVIRSKVRSHEAENSWQIREARRAKAITEFLKTHPKEAKKLRGAKKRLAFLERETKKAIQVFRDLGLSSDLCNFSDPQLFIKAGGAVPVEPCKMNAEKLISELAGLSESEGLELLVAHGIIWQ